MVVGVDVEQVPLESVRGTRDRDQGKGSAQTKVRQMASEASNVGMSAQSKIAGRAGGMRRRRERNAEVSRKSNMKVHFTASET